MPKTTKPPRKRGRPSSYTDAIAAEICRRIAERESLRKICADDHMPHKGAVFRWLAAEENGQFRDQYAYAREMQADALFDEAMEIADETSGDWITTQDGKRVVDHEHVQRSRLRVDTRKWAAGKLAPKRYGDRLDLKHSGKAGGPVTFIMNLSGGDDWDHLQRQSHALPVSPLGRLCPGHPRPCRLRQINRHVLGDHAAGG